MEAHSYTEEFARLIMKRGKKHKARKHIHVALKYTQQTEGSRYSAEEILQEGVRKVQPMFGSRKQSIAGRTYAIPVLLSPKKQVNTAIRWMHAAALSNTYPYGAKLRFTKALSQQIVYALNKQGEAFRKKQRYNAFAQSNKDLLRYKL